MSDQDQNEAGINPNAAADALVSPQHAVLLQRASRSQRFLTYLLDLVFLYVFSFAFGFVIAIVMGITGTFHYFKSVPPIVLGLLFFLVYYVLQEAIFGRTLGKLIVGTRVVTATGGPISFGQAVNRTLCRMIPFEHFSLLGLDEHDGCSGWHDKIPATVVISTRKAE